MRDLSGLGFNAFCVKKQIDDRAAAVRAQAMKTTHWFRASRMPGLRPEENRRLLPVYALKLVAVWRVIVISIDGAWTAQ